MLESLLTVRPQRPGPIWGASYVPPHQRPYGQSPLQHLQAHHAMSYAPVADDMDAEPSDSDVSVTAIDVHRGGSPPTVPVKIPLSAVRLESSDAVDNRLREVTRVEDRNFSKFERLKEKRKRMDEAIVRKRDIQDRKIRTIYDARQRRDARIGARRAREDAEFRRVDDQLEEEEMSLRRRLKRLKRGLAPDESPVPTGRSISTASTSPPGPAYSTIPPPAKRHQSNPPGQSGSPRTMPQAATPTPQVAAPAPSYSFYQGGPKPFMQYQASSAYSAAPPPASTQAPPLPPPPPSVPSQAPRQDLHERQPFSVNGRPASPLTRPPQNATGPPHSLSTVPPPRQISSTYDTRPPPPATNSGFATVNTAPAQSSGFATINARSAATPPSNNSPLAKSDQEQAKPMLHTTSYGSETAGKSSSANSTPAATGKRTPSTTHPYQMSEAFANRHHHCERVDDLNRGIWTSYGQGGTQEHPTGPATEMYLRCNHDNCRRIDWRTVHGLQCHIVKSHEQPKGTIGSLEKALDRYGVPVKEVEQYEREHGEGTGGTVADPKNLKIKNKTREQAGFGGKKVTPGSYGIDPNARPAGYKPSPNASPTAVHSIPRFAGPGQSPMGYPPHGTPGDHKASPGAPAWSSVNHTGSAYGPPRPPLDPSKQLQGDAVMQESTAAPSSSVKASDAGTPVSGQRSYGYGPRPFEYPPRPHPPTPQSAARSPKEANKPSPWGLPARAAQPTPTPASRWGTPSENKTLGPAFEASALQNADQQSKPDLASDKPKPKDVDTIMTDAGATEKEAKSPAKTDATVTETAPVKPPSSAQPAPSTFPAPDAMDVDGGAKKGEATALPAPPSTASAQAEAELKDAVTASGGPASGTRSAQSPLVANKTLSAPNSVKRASRRSSMARRVSMDSGDGRGAGAPATPVQAPIASGSALSAEPASITAGSEEGGDGDNAHVNGGKDAGESVTKENVDGEAAGEADGDSITVASRKQKSEKETPKDSELGPRIPARRAASGRFRKRPTGF